MRRFPGIAALVIYFITVIALSSNLGRAAGRRAKPDLLRTPAVCWQAIEKAENGKGILFRKVGMDLGLAPHRLGFDALFQVEEACCQATGFPTLLFCDQLH